MSVKLLFLAGSARKESFNKKLALCASEIARELGADVTYIDMANYDMPIFNEDLEAESGLPDGAKCLKQLFVEHDGFFIASPEYNSAFSPLLKNALDWISRREEQDKGNLVAYSSKVACISASSPGALGGLRGLVPLRMLLGNISVHVIPEQLALSRAHEAFGDNGQLIDQNQEKAFKKVINAFVQTTDKLKK